MKERFLKYFKECIFPNDVLIRLTNFKEIKSSLEFIFSVVDLDSKEEYQIWKLTTKNVLDYKLNNEYCGDIDQYANHCLLWEYSNRHIELYYKGAADNVMELSGELYYNHVKTAGEWIGFTKHMNGDPTEQLQKNSGLLASGPEELLRVYKQVLEKKGLTTSVLELRGEPKDCEVVIFGNSFVIAEKFKYELIKDFIRNR